MFYSKSIHWQYCRFVFNGTEDYAPISCPIVGEDEEYKDVLRIVFWDFSSSYVCSFISLVDKMKILMTLL